MPCERLIDHALQTLQLHYGARAFVSCVHSRPLSTGTACRGEATSVKLLIRLCTSSRNDESKRETEKALQMNSAVAHAARRASTGDAEWKEQLSELFPQEAGRQPLSRKGPRTQGLQGTDPSDDSAPRHETVEEVFGLESGWSVEVLGSDNGEDGLMLIGSEVQTKHTYTLYCSLICIRF